MSFKDIFVDEANEMDDDDDEENTEKTVIRKNASTCLLHRSKRTLRSNL